jgi:hypothetical protein
MFMPQSRHKRFLLSCLLLQFIIGIVVIGGLFIIVRNTPFGMFGGDCPDASSYGSVTIRGLAQDLDGNPVEGVVIQVQKAEGGCPQSIDENVYLTSTTDGKFEGGVSHMLGDPLIHINVAADGYQAYEFDVSNVYQYTIIQLQIVLAEQLRVQWESSAAEGFNSTLTLTVSGAE